MVRGVLVLSVTFWTRFDQVVLGDLVYCKQENARKFPANSTYEFEDDYSNDAYDSSHIGEGSDASLSEESTLVKAVTEEDLSAGKYTVDDVVLPLPGSRVIYPLNDTGKVYQDLATKDAISLTECVHNIKEFSLTSMTGDYRRVFQKPKDFEWKLLRYTDGNVPLADTDMDVVAKNRPASMVREDSPNGNKDPISDNEAESDREEGQQKEFPCGTSAQEVQVALKLSFTLPASCYATMAIRELLKTSTSVRRIPQDFELVNSLSCVEIWGAKHLNCILKRILRFINQGLVASKTWY
ncbi:hypothetical protein RJ640_027856 [Escallonia rubra]|uniref:Pseudouridylate synthase 7-like protein n=1 Tax=Escallonia rubra TaxID=112253 RepID=A0AA88RX52_9ASTE|nr:hypothetical protein RJ640_027856 [Escallonia rubra]